MSDIFFAKIESLHSMLAWIRERIAHMGISPSESKKMELAIEEAIVNVILHAYQNKGGKIELEVRSQGDLVEIIIKDQGAPFNPLEAKISVDPNQSLLDRKVGGLGIFLMRQYMDEILYQREGFQNVLILRKKKH